MMLHNVRLNITPIIKIFVSLLVGWTLYVLTLNLFPDARYSGERNLFPISVLIYACLLVPVVEELFFRYVLLKVLTRFTSLIIAVMFSVFCFAWFHKNQPVFITSIIAGLFFIFLFLSLGNIVYPIIAHAIYNTLVWFSVSFQITGVLIFLLFTALTCALIGLQSRRVVWSANLYNTKLIKGK